jgi:transcriptional regulator with XRE-family HTH domain
LGESQQGFSNRLGIAVRTVAGYESKKPPKGPVLNHLATIAATAGRSDLQAIFRSAEAKESSSRSSSVAAAIRQLRAALGCTQQELAIKSGLAVSTIARAETRTLPNTAVLKKLAATARQNNLEDIATVLDRARIPYFSWTPEERRRSDITTKFLAFMKDPDPERLNAIEAALDIGPPETQELRQANEIRAAAWLLADHEQRIELNSFLVAAIRRVIAKRGSPLSESELRQFGNLGRAALAEEAAQSAERPLTVAGDLSTVIAGLQDESLTTREIAKILGIAPELVELYRGKLFASSRQMAAPQQTRKSSGNDVRRGTDLSPRDLRILDHLGTVTLVAERIHQRLPFRVELNDLVSAGMKGLFSAATKQPESDDAMFRVYAEFRIRGAILDSLRKQRNKHEVRELAEELEKG